MSRARDWHPPLQRLTHIMCQLERIRRRHQAQLLDAPDEAQIETLFIVHIGVEDDFLEELDLLWDDMTPAQRDRATAWLEARGAATPERSAS